MGLYEDTMKWYLKLNKGHIAQLQILKIKIGPAEVEKELSI